MGLQGGREEAKPHGGGMDQAKENATKTTQLKMDPNVKAFCTKKTSKVTK